VGSNTPTGGAPRSDGLRAIIYAEVEQYARTVLGQMIGRANANADAQSSGDGLGIENIRRGRVHKEINQAANITVTAGSVGVFNSLSTPLTADIVLSGRPLMVFLTGKAYGASGDFCMDVNLRGSSISGGRISGMVGTYLSGLTGGVGFTAFEVVESPAPGRATLEAVACASGVNWTIYVVTGDNALILSAVEL